MPTFACRSGKAQITVPFHQRNCFKLVNSVQQRQLARKRCCTTTICRQFSPRRLQEWLHPRRYGDLSSCPCPARCYLLGTCSTTDRHSHSHIAFFQEGTIGNKALQARLSRTHGRRAWHWSLYSVHLLLRACTCVSCTSLQAYEWPPVLCCVLEPRRIAALQLNAMPCMAVRCCRQYTVKRQNPELRLFRC